MILGVIISITVQTKAAGISSNEAIHVARAKVILEMNPQLGVAMAELIEPFIVELGGRANPTADEFRKQLSSMHTLPNMKEAIANRLMALLSSKDYLGKLGKLIQEDAEEEYKALSVAQKFIYERFRIAAADRRAVAVFAKNAKGVLKAGGIMGLTLLAVSSDASDYDPKADAANESARRYPGNREEFEKSALFAILSQKLGETTMKDFSNNYFSLDRNRKSEEALLNELKDKPNGESLVCIYKMDEMILFIKTWRTSANGMAAQGELAHLNMNCEDTIQPQRYSDAPNMKIKLER
jgi:hypothetical protein